jgi:hypothetical protein
MPAGDWTRELQLYPSAERMQTPRELEAMARRRADHRPSVDPIRAATSNNMPFEAYSGTRAR